VTDSELSPMEDPDLEVQMQRLHRLEVYRRWRVIIVSWFVVIPFLLWQLQEEIALMQSHFTIAALRYAFIFNPECAIALAWCFGITTAVLLWQSMNILFGFSDNYRKQLQKKVHRIRQQGSSHPLWSWIMNHQVKLK